MQNLKAWEFAWQRVNGQLLAMEIKRALATPCSVYELSCQQQSRPQELESFVLASLMLQKLCAGWKLLGFVTRNLTKE